MVQNGQWDPDTFSLSAGALDEGISGVAGIGGRKGGHAFFRNGFGARLPGVPTVPGPLNLPSHDPETTTRNPGIRNAESPIPGVVPVRNQSSVQSQTAVQSSSQADGVPVVASIDDILRGTTPSAPQQVTPQWESVPGVQDSVRVTAVPREQAPQAIPPGNSLRDGTVVAVGPRPQSVDAALREVTASVPGEPVPNQGVPGQVVQERFVPGSIVPARITPERVVPGQVGPERVGSERVAPDPVAPDVVVPVRRSEQGAEPESVDASIRIAPSE
jgi:hypothetical protein